MKFADPRQSDEPEEEDLLSNVIASLAAWMVDEELTRTRERRQTLAQRYKKQHDKKPH